MQGRLTPLGVFLKWILIPGALAAVGYFVLGPRIGKGIFERVKLPSNVRSMLNPADEKEAKPKQPSVEVSVKPSAKN